MSGIDPACDSPVDEEIRSLVRELSDAEAHSLDVVGPITSRLHQAILKLCNSAGIPNKWETVDDPTKYKQCQTCGCAIVE